MTASSGWTGDRVEVTIRLLFIGQRQGSIDGDPVLEVDLVVLSPDAVTRPLAPSLRVPIATLDHLVEGLELPAVVSAPWVGARGGLVGRSGRVTVIRVPRHAMTATRGEPSR